MADTPTDEKPVAEERRGFEAEVSKLLHLMVNAVYSNREVFLRELISNASDACDKLRYQALTSPDLTADDPEFRIRIAVDEDVGTLTVSDNGIGMSRDDLIENLGTIARSGTQAFLERLSGNSGEDMSLIGQFGVGFYSSFMAADRVRVITRRAGEDDAWEWESDGAGEYVIRPGERASRGADIVLHLKEDGREFLDADRLEAVLRKYSDHIGVPILLQGRKAGDDGDATGEDKAVNDGSALWTRPKTEISEEQYTEFYRHAAHALDEPALTLHSRVEGMISYTALLFIPSQRPMDLFDPARKPRVKLYVKRVYITDDTEDLIPGWLRFLRGVVDSEDLSLNISREMLQSNPVMLRLRKSVTRKVLGELESLAQKDAEKYNVIWENFGAVLKEGLYEDEDRRDQLLKLARFRSTHGDGWVSLADYVARMKDKQSAIYYVTGQDAARVARSPQLEGFRKRGIEVLLLSDPVDDFWLTAIHDFDGKPFKSITRGASDLKDMDATDTGDDKADSDGEDTPAKDGDLTLLTTVLKDILGDAVTDVRTSDRLTETAACLVADDSGLDIHLERLLRQHQQLGDVSPKVLEINPDHSLVRCMARRAGQDGARAALEEPAMLLLDQARVLEGDTPPDPSAFATRLCRAMERALDSACD